MQPQRSGFGVGDSLLRTLLHDLLLRRDVVGDRVCASLVLRTATVALLSVFFQAEDGIRDYKVTGVPDVCSSDLGVFRPRVFVTRRTACWTSRPKPRPFASLPRSSRWRTGSGISNCRR